MTPDELLTLIEERAEALAVHIETLGPETFQASPGTDEWTIAELAGHVSEFPRTFAAEAVRLAANLGVTVGRRLDDDGRLAALHALDGRSPAEAATLVRERAAEALATLRKLRPGDWASEGVRGNDGSPITTRGIVEQMIADHLGAHVEQVRAAAETLRQHHA